MLNTAEKIASYVILILQVKLLLMCASRGFSLFSQKSLFAQVQFGVFEYFQDASLNYYFSQLFPTL